MIRGTTTPFTIKLPCTVSDLDWITIKWWQDGNKGTLTAPLPITKKLKHCLSNIYVCTLSSDVVKEKKYYFTINNVVYEFTAQENLGVGRVLKYNEVTKILTADTLIMTVNIVEDSGDVAPLTFINEAYLSDTLSVSLMAFETMRFSDKHKAKVQFRGKRKSNGKVFGCKPKLFTVYPINDDLLDDDFVVPEDDNEWVVLDGQSVIGGDLNE